MWKFSTEPWKRKRARKLLPTRDWKIHSNNGQGNESLDESLIVSQVLSGETGKYRLLVEKYEKSVFNLVSRLLQGSDRAHDVAQEAFINGYKGLKGFDVRRPFGPWILKIARNCALAELQKMGRRREMEDLKNDFVEEHHQSPSEPAATVERKYELSAIEAVLSELSEKFSSVIILRHQEQMKQAEIATVLGIPTGTVKSRLSFAYSYMRKRLSAMGMD